MFISEKNPQIEQYLLPEYWGGHTIGSCVGKPHSEEFTIQGLGHNIGAAAAAQEILQEYVNSGTPRFVLESYRRGDTFKLAEQRVGAVIFAKNESLFGRKGVVVDQQSLEGIACPEYDTVMPRDGRRYYGDYFTDTTEDETLTYLRTYSWGTVVSTNKGNALALCPEPAYKPNRSKTGVIVSRTHLKHPSIADVEIGRTQHLPPSGTFLKLEALNRILALDVCSYGNAAKEPKKVFAFLGRAASNPAS